MREFKLEPIFLPIARATLEALDPLHQAEVSHRIELIAAQPEPDDHWTFAWEEEGSNTFIFYDDVWLLIYSIVDDGTVLEVRLIERAGAL